MNNLLTNLVGLAPDPEWTPPLPRGGGGTSWLYPICILLGFAVAIALACIKMKWRYKISIEPFYLFILIGVPTAILGARFGSCAIGQTEWRDFFHDFGSGLAVEWGVIFVLIAAFIYFPLILKKPKFRVKDVFSSGNQEVKRVSFWMYADAIMPCILIAQFIGRWGNYCNQEVYGAIVTDNNLSWFLYHVLPGMYIDGNWHQPLFFWEGIGNLAMFFVLYFGVEFIKQRKAGDMAACYILWYGVFRACLEPLRSSQFKFITSIVLSCIFAVVGLVFIIFNHLFLVRKRNYYMARLIGNGASSVLFKFKIQTAEEYMNSKSYSKLYEKEKNRLNKNVASTAESIEKAKQNNEIELANEMQFKLNELQRKQVTFDADIKQAINSCFRQEQEKIYYGAW